MNIVLIGYRCSGKTKVGKILASEMGRDFLDTDSLIEKNMGCSIESIVSSKGWDHFREIEKDVIRALSRKDNLVVATGGGVVMDKDNVKELKRNGWIVWLNGTAAALKKRMDKDRRSGKIRPSLGGGDPLREIGEVLSMRRPLYEEAYDRVVDTSALSVEQVAGRVIQGLPKDRRQGIT
jgi:shikimate kinase